MDRQTRNYNTQANVAAYIENRNENVSVYYGQVKLNKFILHVFTETEDVYENIKQDIENMSLQDSRGNTIGIDCEYLSPKSKAVFICSFT